MTIDIGQFWDNSFCISISGHRFDTFRAVFGKEFGRTPKLIPGFKVPDLPGYRNCTLSHLAVIKMAKALDLPFVAIFEDDAYPCIRGSEEISLCLDSLPDDAGMVYLGWSWITPGAVRCKAGAFDRMASPPSGSHAYILMKSAYDELLRAECGNVSVDVSFSNVTNLYRLRKPIFIQYCDAKSMNGHVGYISHEKSSMDAPHGFRRIESYVGYRYDASRVSQFAQKLKWTKKSTRCLVIGSNPSIANVYLRDYVNAFDGDVVRINRTPVEDMIVHYGSRTDTVFTCQWYEENVFRTSGVDKIVIDHDMVMDMSRELRPPRGKWLTTGMIAILLALSIYDSVEILGFGIPEVTEGGLYKSIHPTKICDMKSAEFGHDLNFEHWLIGILASVNYAGRLMILETDGRKS